METITSPKSITNAIEINSSLQLVWYAWTISERVSEWFAPEAIVETKEGGAYELYFIPGNQSEMNTRGCKIIKLINQKELKFTWKGPDQFAHFMNNENQLTTVSVHFEQINEQKTKVQIVHTRFLEDAHWNEALNWHQLAWTNVLQSLKSALEKGEGNL